MQHMTKSRRSGSIPPPCLTPTLWLALAKEVTEMKAMKEFPKNPEGKEVTSSLPLQRSRMTLNQQINNT